MGRLAAVDDAGRKRPEAGAPPAAEQRGASRAIEPSPVDDAGRNGPRRGASRAIERGGA
jgi:hypothetical protein